MAYGVQTTYPNIIMCWARYDRSPVSYEYLVQIGTGRTLMLEVQILNLEAVDG